MSVDLTRFDFYAKNFMHSDNVRAMSFAEIGQYIFLLCESWLTGKDCTLPEDPVVLAGLCRGVKVTDKVLELFPVVPGTTRRRNNRLYEEWLEAVKRSEDGRRAVLLRKDRSTTVYTPVEQDFDGRSTHTTEVVGTQAKPNQISSNQTKSSHDSGNFHNIAIKYRTAMGRGHSKAKTVRAKYAEVCSQFGEDAVLVAFDEWAESNQWRKDNLGNSGLRFFFSDLGDIIEETKAVAALKPKETVVSEDEVERINREANEQALKALEPLRKKIREEEEAAEKLRSTPFAC